MLQFRAEDIEQIGRGTRFKVGNFDEYLIIQDNAVYSPNNMRLLNVNTYHLAGSFVEVDNPDWITETEFERLINFLNIAVSDCSFANGSDPIKY